MHETQDSADTAKLRPLDDIHRCALQQQTFNEGPNHCPENPAQDDLSRVRLLLPTTWLMICPTVPSFPCGLYWKSIVYSMGEGHIYVVSGRTNDLAPYCHHQIFILVLTL
jgi:hypothetical protein